MGGGVSDSDCIMGGWRYKSNLDNDSVMTRK